MREIHFYMDDSGSRDLDRRPRGADGQPDWFALGGVLVWPEDKAAIKERVASLRQKWQQMGDVPLHSSEVRNRSGNFRWLEELHVDKRLEFYNDISSIFKSSPVICLACVIDRQGYDQRYRERYGTRRWLLCKTAFSIAVERAAKFAIHHGARLRVFAERTDKAMERRLESYYRDLRDVGLPFDGGNSAKYAPLAQAKLRQTLFEFRVKPKQSTCMQLADLALWPMCRGGYDPSDHSYQVLRTAGRLIDSHCTPENGLLGIKYSCRDSQEAQIQEPA